VILPPVKTSCRDLTGFGSPHRRCPSTTHNSLDPGRPSGHALGHRVGPIDLLSREQCGGAGFNGAPDRSRACRRHYFRQGPDRAAAMVTAGRRQSTVGGRTSMPRCTAESTRHAEAAAGRVDLDRVAMASNVAGDQPDDNAGVSRGLFTPARAGAGTSPGEPSLQGRPLCLRGSPDPTGGVLRRRATAATHRGADVVANRPRHAPPQIRRVAVLHGLPRDLSPTSFGERDPRRGAQPR
jgi:hypothetical protein